MGDAAEDFTWTTRDGNKLRLSEMQTSHIENCLRMLQRTLSERPSDGYYMGDSEYAEQAVDSENAHNDRLAASLEEAIKVFNTELKLRENDPKLNNGDSWEKEGTPKE